MHFLFGNIKKFWPILFLVAIEVLLFAVNYIPGTFLVGWDNALPDFNFKENLMRNVFGVWQSYRGLGLYDGMSHAAALLHTLFIGALSLILPLSLHRYIFIFLMHFLGGLGMFFLLKKLFKDHVVSLAGALFYLLNIATIQMFFTPYEAFAIHYASLPWLALTALNYVTERSKKSLLLFNCIVLLTTPQFFVPTLVTSVFLFLLLLTRSVRLLFYFLLINAFWLLPFLYGIRQNGPVIAGAKINQMSSEEAYLRNHEFGNLGSVLRLRGYTVNFEDYGPSGQVVYLMQPWRQLLANPIINIGTWIVVAVFVSGVCIVLIKRKREFYPFLLPLTLSFFILGNDIPGIREIINYLRTNVPFFAEAFRYPFTKFGLLFAFSYTIFFTIALSQIKRFFIVIPLLLLLVIPAFRGNFISPGLRVAIPREYFSLFDFMKTQDPTGRIAVLPQHTFWSWKLYHWGYRGSGFLWFGLQQPLMDRAFDPWSTSNENYYWELSRALYSKDAEALKSVFAKYDIHYILLDENLDSAGDDRSLFIDESKELLAKILMITKVTQFGKLTVYENHAVRTTNFMKFATNLPSVSPVYQWTDNDVAYQQRGDYISAPGGYIYPFRSLFTKRSISEREFDARQIPKSLVYDSGGTDDLDAKNIKSCSLRQNLGSLGENIDTFLRFTSSNERGCLSFGIANLEHKNGYLVEVESRHIAGRALTISFINNTAHHSELETKLPTDTNWQTTYFILPPLASDGLGYTVYVSNDAINPDKTVNDLSRIRFFQIPYREFVNASIASEKEPKNSVFILSQAYDPGWVAWDGKKFLPHILVNNWENGWIVDSPNSKPFIFFVPQLLEWIGGAIAALTFLLIVRPRKVK